MTTQPSQESQESQEDARAELERLDREIAELRRAAHELRERLADRAEDPTDGPERTEVLTIAEEQEAIAAELAARREELLRRIAAS